jgi:hypothetical protein
MKARSRARVMEAQGRSLRAIAEAGGKMSNVGVAGVLRSRRGHEVHCRSRRLHHRHRHPALADPVYCSPSFQGYRPQRLRVERMEPRRHAIRAGQRRQALDDMAMEGHRDDHGHIA